MTFTADVTDNGIFRTFSPILKQSQSNDLQSWYVKKYRITNYIQNATEKQQHFNSYINRFILQQG